MVQTIKLIVIFYVLQLNIINASLANQWEGGGEEYFEKMIVKN